MWSTTRQPARELGFSLIKAAVGFPPNGSSSTCAGRILNISAWRRPVVGKTFFLKRAKKGTIRPVWTFQGSKKMWKTGSHRVCSGSLTDNGLWANVWNSDLFAKTTTTSSVSGRGRTASLYRPDIILTTSSAPHHYKQRNTEADECVETPLWCV